MDSELANRTTDDLCAAMESFEPDELAYLALTGKIEIPLRDRLAWKAHGNRPSPRYYTAREWNKTDFAIIEDGQPVLLLEAKALYSFDAIRPKTLARYEGYIRHDIDKATALAGSETEVMVVVFMTHVAVPVPDHLDRIVKYRPSINKALTTYADPDALRNDAIEAIESILRPLGPTKQARPWQRDEGLRGQAFGIPVQVDAWLTHTNAAS